MRCEACSTENRAGRKYCAECGAPLAVPCRACGAGNEPTAKFCGECGGPLQTEDTSLADDRQTVLQPAQERRFISVLFADLTGFTPLAETRDPEEVRDLLGLYFDRSSAVVERFGGTVDKFIGDALMAVWGAVETREDDAERAVRAGLELVDIAAALGAEAGIPDLALRVGIMTGEAAVGPGGNRAGLVIGDLVNTASRLQAIAEAGSVVVGDATQRTTNRAIQFEALGPRQLKGKSDAVQAWRALRVVSLRGGDDVADGLEPPFVGRVEELRLLKDRLHAAGRDQRPRLVSIVGIAGIGKSRLVREFLRYVDGLVETVYWHEGRSPAYGDGITFWALGEMVRQRTGIAEGEDPASAIEKLRATLDDVVTDPDERRRTEPPLIGLLGLGDVPTGERGELFAAFRTFFERIADRGTSVLVFDDLHWADDGMLDFIDELPEWSRTSPILVVTLSRPEILERRPDWGSGRHSSTAVHLGPLSRPDMTELVSGTTPGLPGAVLDDVLDRAAGIPLYAVELLRMLIADGQLRPEDGRYVLTGDAAQWAIPESLHAVIGARLDRLPGRERDLLQLASVLGQSFTAGAVTALAAAPPDEVGEILGVLVKKELLNLQRDERSPGRGQHAFVQSLIREVAYSRLSRHDRHRLHVATADFYRALDEPEMAAAVAGHYVAAAAAMPDHPEAGAVTALALEALEDAAGRAAALHSHGQVVALADQALAMSPPDADVGWAYEAAAKASNALASADAEGYAQRGIAFYETRGNDAGRLRLIATLGRILSETSHAPDRTITELTPHVGHVALDRPELVAIAAELARAHMLSGNPDDALKIGDRASDAAERLDLLTEIAELLNTRGTALGDQKRRLREGVALVRGAIDIADSHDLRRAHLRALVNLAYLLGLDDPVAATSYLEEGLELARRYGERGLELTFSMNVTGGLIQQGRFADARDLIASLALDHVPPRTRAGFELAGLYIDAITGDAGRAAEAAEAFAAAVHTTEDPQFARNLRDGVAAVLFMAGRVAESYDLEMSVFAQDPFNYPNPLVTAAGAAIWLRDRARIEDVQRSLDASSGKGRIKEAVRLALAAAHAALSGDPEAAGAHHAASDAIQVATGTVWGRTLSLAAFAHVAPDHPLAPGFDALADDLARNLGAEQVLERLRALD